MTKETTTEFIQDILRTETTQETTTDHNEETTKVFVVLPHTDPPEVALSPNEEQNTSETTTELLETTTEVEATTEIGNSVDDNNLSYVFPLSWIWPQTVPSWSWPA